MGKGKDFEPVVVAFCCWWCAYGAADLAGMSKMEYPVNIRIVRVPCSGRVDQMHILRAFKEGADGVVVAGCLEGGCHYVDGNIKCKRRVEDLKKKLEAIGLGSERLEMYFMSASMSTKFVECMKEFYERIKRLGPSPLREVQSK